MDILHKPSSQRETAPGIVFVLIISSCILALLTQTVMAKTDWKSHLVAELTPLLSRQTLSSQALFIADPVDATNMGTYYPFISEITAQIKHLAQKRQLQLTNDPTGAVLFLYPKYTARQRRLLLTFSLQNTLSDGELGTATVELNDALLPIGWRDRSLKDIAYELTGKLDEALFGHKIDAIFDEFSGGLSDSETFVSEFSSVMRGYLQEEIGSIDSVNLILAENAPPNSPHIKGHFQKVGSEILVRLRLVGNGRESANVSTRFPISSIPHGMALFPENINVAKETADVPLNEKYETEPISPTVSVWLNHENRIYREGDPLIVHIRPDESLYARAYYIQSDGMIFQIFPSTPGRAGRLRKGMAYAIGGKSDDVELIITDETVGQESIKLFISRGPIDDSALPKRFIEGANVTQIKTTYRGLRANYKVGPAVELKLLVRSQ